MDLSQMEPLSMTESQTLMPTDWFLEIEDYTTLKSKLDEKEKKIM